MGMVRVRKPAHVDARDHLASTARGPRLGLGAAHSLLPRQVLLTQIAYVLRQLGF